MLTFAGVATLAFAGRAACQDDPGELVWSSEINGHGGGDFLGQLDPDDRFSQSVCSVGDLDGDGVLDLAVGASGDDDDAVDAGAVWILFMRSDGTVRSHSKIKLSDVPLTEGPVLSPAGALFGVAVAALGDLNGDSIPDLVVGGSRLTIEGNQVGGIWIVFLDSAGAPIGGRLIAGDDPVLGEGAGPFAGFGAAIAVVKAPGYFGACSLAVGAPAAMQGGVIRGVVWILSLEADGALISAHRIGQFFGGFGTGLDSLDFFGSSIAGLGDADGDGNEDIAVGAPWDDDGAPALGAGNFGAVWVLHLGPTGLVTSKSKISAVSGGFEGPFTSPVFGDSFGSSLAFLGDLDGDGCGDLLVGAPLDTEGTGASFFGTGAVWVLFLDQSGTVVREQKIGQNQGNLQTTLEGDASFGWSVSLIGDLDGDGVPDAAIGQGGGIPQTGGVFVCFMNAGHWATEGGGIASPPCGKPALRGASTLVGGEAVMLGVRNGPVRSNVFVAIDSLGTRGFVQPFSIDAVLFAGTTDDVGALTYEGRWPVGIATDSAFAFQAWTWCHESEPGALIASNVITATTP